MKEKSSIEFPVRQIRVIRADVEIRVEVSDSQFDRLIEVFNEQEMNPLMRLTVVSPGGGAADFSNLTLERIT